MAVTVVIKYYLFVSFLAYTNFCLRTVHPPANLLSDSPPTWNLPQIEDFLHLLSWPDVEEQFQPLGAKRWTTSWTQWSSCPPCLNTSIDNTIQMRVRVTKVNAQYLLGSQARLCDPTPPACPEVHFVGCWKRRLEVTDASFTNPLVPYTVSQCGYKAKNYGKRFFTARGGFCAFGSADIMLYQKLSSHRCEEQFANRSDVMDLYSLLEDDAVELASLWSSCSSVCNNGIRRQNVYRLLEINEADSDQVELYLAEQNFKHCTYSNSNCVWNKNRPVWYGCYSGIQDVIGSLEGHSDILDRPVEERDAFIQKCAEAAYVYNYTSFVIRQRSCYYIQPNLPSGALNEYQKSYDCDSVNPGSSGEGFDVYGFESRSVVWSGYEYGPCSQACGGGVRNKSQATCVTVSSNGCEEILHNNTTELCNSQLCPMLSYVHVGCYQVRTSIEIVVDHPLLDGNAYMAHDALKKCAIIAHESGHVVFGIYDGGYCAMGEYYECYYHLLGQSTECAAGKGASDAVSMYSFNIELPHTFSKCEDVFRLGNFAGIKNVIDEVEFLQNSTEVTADQIESFLDSVQDLKINSTDLANATSTLLKLSAEKLVITSSDEGEAVLQSLKSVLVHITDESAAEIWGESAVFLPLLEAVEALVTSCSEQQTTSTNNITIGAKIKIMSMKLNKTEHKLNGMKLEIDKTDKSGLFIPAEVFQASSEVSLPSLAVISYNNISNFIGEIKVHPKLRKKENDIFNISSKIVSITLGLVEAGERLKEPISLTLPIPLNQSTDESSFIEDYTCVFWNVTESVWSSSGCYTKNVSPTLVECICDHLTSFAVLMRYNEYRHNENEGMALTVISYIGSIISICCLIATFVIFLYLDNLRTERKKIHMNLVVALALAQTTHVVGIDLTYDSLTCSCIALLLHYLYTATFSWMFCEGLHLYYKIVSVFETEGMKKRIAYYVTGWGMPAVIVTISAGVRWNGYGSPDFCWLSIKDGLIWAFVGPVCVVSAINLVILIIVIRIVVKSATSIRDDESRKRKSVKAAAKSVLILTPILGVNWLLGLLAVNEKLLVFEFLFVLLNSSQGLFIFLFHCVGSSEVRSAFQRKREMASKSLTDNSKNRSKMAKRKNATSTWLGKQKKSWPPAIFEQTARLQPQKLSSDNNVIGGLVTGELGRNLGGIKHMVISPATPDVDDDESSDIQDGVNNIAFEGDDRDGVSPTESNSSYCTTGWSRSRLNTSKPHSNTKMSVSTATTSLGGASEVESRRDSCTSIPQTMMKFSQVSLHTDTLPTNTVASSADAAVTSSLDITRRYELRIRTPVKDKDESHA